MLLRFCCFLVLWNASAIAQTVDGSVVDSASGIGIAGAKVELIQGDERVYSVSADPQGNFRLEKVKEGSYTVRFSSPDHFRELNFRFQVIAGTNPAKLEGRLLPLGRIAGHVMDSKGTPLPNARLEVVSETMHLFARTDSNGKFNLHHYLVPGNYSLSAIPPVGLKPPAPEQDSGRVLGWVRTYYPGAADAQTAANILLRPGGQLLDIEIRQSAEHFSIPTERLPQR